MIPMPVLDEPFSWIAMDIVRPLPRSSQGNRYILVVCDYATRYPEAFALKSIDAETVADSLIQLFSRIGIRRRYLLTKAATSCLNFYCRCTSVLASMHCALRRTTRNRWTCRAVQSDAEGNAAEIC